MWQRLSLGWRIGLGFGFLVAMAAVLVALAAFGLSVATKGLNGITGSLIPANALASNAKYSLMQARAAEETLAASVNDAAARTAARAEWLQTQASLNEGMEGYARLAKDDQSKAALAEFRGHVESYREAAAPVVEKIADGAMADISEARAALVAARPGHTNALDMLLNIERGQVRRGNEVFAKVDKALASIKLWVFGLCFVAAVGAVVLAWRVTQSVVQPVRRAMAEAERLAEGDLRPAAEVTGHDELAQMLRTMERMQIALAQVVGQVRQAAESVGTASHEVASGNGDLSIRTEQTAASLEQTASAMEQMNGSVRQTAELARQADELARHAREAARRGGEAVTEVVGTMAEINSSSRRIADIIGVIDTIAFRTNILALNASVEAARAGEQGRGFAVVAEEVRTLAQRSADAAREIRGLIDGSVERVDLGTQRVEAAGGAMADIVVSVGRVGDVIAEISAAVSEQSEGVGQIADAINTLDRNTQQNASLVEESAAAAESLRDQADRLVEVVATFRLA